MCKPVSISGCHFAGCGTPKRRSISGNSLSNAPQLRRTSKKMRAFEPRRASSASFQTRSGTNASTSPAETMFRMSIMVSPEIRKSRSDSRAANFATRRMRTGSSPKASETWRSVRFSMSAIPPWGSIKLPSSSFAIALMVRSRRDRSSSIETSGEKSKAKP